MGNFIGAIVGFLWGSWAALAAWTLLIMLVLYIVPLVICLLLPPKDLKKTYKTEWALVTGGSSGIGAALVEQLAEQGLNVMVVAIADKTFAEFEQKMKKKFPKLDFKFVGTDLTNDNPDTGYMATIKKETENLDIGVVFSNAGFIRIGAFANFAMDLHVKHIECNVMSGLKIAHHFFNLWKKAGRRGALNFTASSAGYFVAPYSSIYGATKAFMNNFCSSLAVEGKHNNIDILCFNPQYTKTKLYDNAEKLGVLDFFALFGSEPSDVAKTMLKAVGRLSLCDQGLYSIGMRIFAGILFDLNILTPIMALGMTFAPEYKKLK